MRFVETVQLFHSFLGSVKATALVEGLRRALAVSPSEACLQTLDKFAHFPLDRFGNHMAADVLTRRLMVSEVPVSANAV